ncbi:23S rRNA m2A2503 methyltransferase and tRNA A37 C2 methyltransferase [Streptococcus thermophilus]|uniref:23S rRNA (adenine(2503)-C(2))-methyltransferase RlmN n=1 Tax=Streptococcus thermophilus TaxID=1308 RepID=UPI0015C285D4|nr:23S rRNA (adenine(2503)-C(2))-methyltransferase RlmN [Streptococcus thermophilus]CAD0146080.1 23S rRNA m2A2503 methyltransferase and tRNA A37 C2 methyltransferase [Streptococcus thermophilus]
MSEVTTQSKPERRKRQKLEDMEGYKPSIYGLTRDELIDWAVEHGEKKFRATQIWDWLYKKRVQSFEEMANISKDFIAKLNDNFCVNPLKQRIVQESKDGTVKYLFELPDGMLIETVLMRQHYGLSVCVTTQVGCNIGCTFCASGLIKKQRDLTAGEIVAQIMLVQKYFDDRGDGERVSHVVVMGIGEPFDNYDNVLRFLRTINNDNGLAIGARHITVSTSGLAPKIKEFANEGVQVNLAVSLHAPNNDLRSSIMRINRSFPLEKLFEAIGYYIQTTNRRVTFEYIMLNEVNDHPENAQELADLTKKIRKLSYINLIPYNPVSEHDQYSRSTKERVAAFYDVLKKNGVNCVVRQEHGTDIDAACGQLRSNTMKRDRQKAVAEASGKSEGK